MTPCEIFIRQRIETQGPISLAEYIKIALTHPEHGFYMTQDPFGARGHFTTAPEVSQLFGELLGLWAVDQWIQMGTPEKIAVLELGPGRGTLMRDFLRASQVRPDFLKAIRLHLVEISPILKQHQRETVNDPTLVHHRSLQEAFPHLQDLPLLLIANEYFDALPIHQFEKTDRGWMERYIALDDSFGAHGFCYTLKPANPSLRLPEAPLGSIYEMNPQALEDMEDLCKHLNKVGGSSLIIDYGYEGPAFGDTFQALFQHKYHPPLENAGSADLTAHVDFSSLIKIVRRHPALTYRFVTQETFLRALGIDVRLQILEKKANAAQKALLRSGTHRLTDPEQMGRLFKVLEIRNPQRTHA